MSESADRLASALAHSYAIERALGSGGMATVYLARDIKHERNVAVKVLHPELAALLGPERFLREIKITANLNHPHILPLLDSGAADGFLYYVMPHVEGESLRARLHREKQLPIEDALRISTEVADALAHAHARSIIHRDIKPENVLLHEGHAVVADFGIAHVVTAAGSERLTETGIVVGTPAYLSPEQAAGDRDIDGRSDVYALGCVLYEMLAGNPPITGPTLQAVLARKSTESPPSVSNVRKTVPPDLERVLTRALALMPADRQRSAAELSRELAALSAVPATTGRRKNRRFVAGAASLAALAIVTTGLVILWQTVISGTPSTDVATGDRVIVLPYDNETGDPALDPVGRMVAEWITEGLAQTGIVQVAPSAVVLEAMAAAKRDSVSAAGGTMRRVADITESGIAVTGSYYRSGQQLEFHSEIVDLDASEPLTTVESVRGAVEDPVRAIDSVRVSVVGALGTLLNPTVSWELPPSVRPPTYDAYREYSLALDEWSSGEYAKSGASFERAYGMDTTYVRSLMFALSAYGNAGDAASGDRVLGLLGPKRQELALYDRYRLDFTLAIRRGNRAAALEVGRAGVRLVPLGTVRFAFVEQLILDNRLDEATESFEGMRRWITEVAPQWYRTWGLYTDILHLRGEHQRELEIAREGRERATATLFVMEYEGRALAALGRIEELLDLVSQIPSAIGAPGTNPGIALRNIAAELRVHGLSEQSIAVADSALDWLEQQPDGFRASNDGRMLHGELLYLLENWDEAAPVFDSLARGSSSTADAVGYRGTVAAHRGDLEEARRWSQRLLEVKSPERRPWLSNLWRARIAAVLGDKSEAVGLLRRAFGQGAPYGMELHTIIDFQSLREYQPFLELIRPKG